MSTTWCCIGVNTNHQFDKKNKTKQNIQTNRQISIHHFLSVALFQQTNDYHVQIMLYGIIIHCSLDDRQGIWMDVNKN